MLGPDGTAGPFGGAGASRAEPGGVPDHRLGPAPAGLEAAGVRLAYRQAGAGRPVLMIHGNTASSRWFAEQLAAPPAGHRLIAPDLPNYGASGTLPAPLAIADYAAPLEALLDRLTDEPAVLVGHSLGGAVAQAIAARRPGRTRGLLLVASAPPGGFVTPEEHYALLARLPGNRALLERSLAPVIGAHRPDYFEQLVDDALAMRDFALEAGGRALAAFDVTAAARGAACPVLVLRGTADPIISEEMARATAAAYPRAELAAWEGVGHSPQLEAAARFNELLARFLAGLP